MIIRMIKNHTRILGKSQGFLGLPVRDEIINERITGPNTPCMVTAWEPTPEELKKLNNGASVSIRILGTMHPPIMVGVEE